MDIEVEQNYPPLVKRFQSLLIDQVFIVICMAFFSVLLGDPENGNTNGLRGFLFFALFLAYEPFCMSFGCSVGNYIAGIRVRQFNDQSKKINIFNSYLRFAIKYLLGIISFFTVTSDKFKRAIHDKASGSIMIYSKNAG